MTYRPQYDPTVPRSVSGVYPARFTRTAMLLPDGLSVVGWVPHPAVASWEPEDLLWTPPGTKMGPDRLGEVVDVKSGEIWDWARAQLDKRNRFNQKLRELVLSGRLQLDAALAKRLGMTADAIELDELGNDRHDLYAIRRQLGDRLLQ